MAEYTLYNWECDFTQVYEKQPSYIKIKMYNNYECLQKDIAVFRSKILDHDQLLRFGAV